MKIHFTIKIIISKKNESLFSYCQKEHEFMDVNHYDIIELVHTQGRNRGWLFTVSHVKVALSKNKDTKDTQRHHQVR